MLSLEEYQKRYWPDVKSSAVLEKYYQFYQESLMVSEDYVMPKVKHKDYKKKSYLEYNKRLSEEPELPKTPWIILDDLTPFKLDNFDTPNYQSSKTIEKGNNPMYNIENDKYIASSKINYLNERLEIADMSKRDDMLQTFGLVDDNTPRTWEEALARIQAGKFTFEKPKHQWSWTDGLRWRDPAKKEDHAGYDAACMTLATIRTAAKDAIMSGVYADGLSALKAFEAWTPKVTAHSVSAS